MGWYQSNLVLLFRLVSLAMGVITSYPKSAMSKLADKWWKTLLEFYIQVVREHGKFQHSTVRINMLMCMENDLSEISQVYVEGGVRAIARWQELLVMQPWRILGNNHMNLIKTLDTNIWNIPVSIVWYERLYVREIIVDSKVYRNETVGISK